MALAEKRPVTPLHVSTRVDGLRRTRMRMKMRLAVLSAGFALLSAGWGDDRLSDRAGTLELSEELDARGRLGGVTVDALGFLYGSFGNVIDSRADLF